MRNDVVFLEMVKRAGIPKRYQDVKFGGLETQNPAHDKVVAAVRQWVARFPYGGDAGSLFILGDIGTGKTHMACAALLNIMSHCSIEASYQSSDMLMVAAQEAQFESEIIKKFGSVPLLVIDGFDILWGSEYGILVVRNIVERRIYSGLRTIFVSNQDVAGLTAIYGSDFMKLAMDGAVIVHCNWSDYRLRSVTRIG
ncbi:ATP-binding protein [Chromobacterium subtsugae]|uniref:ATP-binding protein n=1 Tax=Chromobacterium subtsugae TaxID=251747 RepID=UPI000A77ED61|nr:ATP-binding protein [Chromobacterium subtsugae]